MDERREIWWPSPTTDLARVVRVRPPGGFVTVRGASFDALQFSYESWGTLDAARENAVLVIHPLAMDCHAAGQFRDEPLGWWEPIIGPGRAIDTDRHFVVCPNLLGGCYGSTGPRFAAPDGQPWLERFPLLTPLDLMRAQRLFLEALGIARPLIVIGPSMGGMVAWEWAVEAADAVERVVVVAAPLRTTAYQIGLNWLQRRGIELDLSGDDLAARAGQMIARGVGMLSYRAPVGLEQKFGRDWFKPPGASLGERGMFNVESWLRHHGKKAVKRFDPYTYLLFSRAMDLHDVGAERGGIVAALDRVRADVLVVGISSDELYPPSEVQLGAEILGHIGRGATYQEIRSPHGHDAFLLEPEQLSAILRGTGRAPRVRLGGGSAPDVRTVRVGVLGAGRVATHLLRLIEERRADLIDRFALRLEVAGVAEIDSAKELDPVFDGIDVVRDPQALIERGDLDVIVELTRGGDAAPLVERALRRGHPVVTPDKSLIRKHGERLERLALEHGTRLAYHNAIAAGWPLLYALERPLGRQPVFGIRALLSSTCNVTLERIEQGDDPAAALAHAVALGIAERDPELDRSGWDTAQKLSILAARAGGERFGADAIPYDGIAALDPALVRAAPAAGYRIKLCGLWLGGAGDPVLGVLPAAVEVSGHLGGTHGDSNVVVLDGGDDGELVFVGKGAGDLPVASAVLGDLVGLFVPRRSWTALYPRSTRTPRAPEFSGHLTLAGGRATAIDRPAPGAVPILGTLLVPRAPA